MAGTGDMMAPTQHQWDERLKIIEAQVNRLVEAIIGGLDGSGGILRRADRCEAQIAEHERRIDALEREAAARIEKAGDRVWSLALDALKATAGGAIGAAIAVIASRGGH